MSDELTTYWLIERDGRWWQEGGRADDGHYIEVWTDQASLAVHFPSEEAGRREADRLVSFGVRGTIYVTEHMDLPPPK